MCLPPQTRAPTRGNAPTSKRAAAGADFAHQNDQQQQQQQQQHLQQQQQHSLHTYPKVDAAYTGASVLVASDYLAAPFQMAPTTTFAPQHIALHAVTESPSAAAAAMCMGASVEDTHVPTLESLSGMDFDLSSWLSECKALGGHVDSPPSAVPELEGCMWDEGSGSQAAMAAGPAAAAAAACASASGASGQPAFGPLASILKTELCVGVVTPIVGGCGSSSSSNNNSSFVHFPCTTSATNAGAPSSSHLLVGHMPTPFTGLAAHFPQHDRFLSETSDDSSEHKDGMAAAAAAAAVECDDGDDDDCGSNELEEDDLDGDYSPGSCMLPGSVFGDAGMGGLCAGSLDGGSSGRQPGCKKPRKRKLASDLSPHELAKTREINRVAAQRHRIIAKQKKMERKVRFEAVGRRNEELRREMHDIAAELNTLKKLALSMYGPSGPRHAMLLSRSQLAPLPSLG